MIITLNSKFNRYGNRLNLIINYNTREYYFYGSHTADIGEVFHNLPIKEVERKEKELKHRYFKQVSHEALRNWF